MKVEQLHRRDHSANAKGQRYDLDQPKSEVTIQNGQQADVEQRHQRADNKQLPVRPRLQIRQSVAPTGQYHRHTIHTQLAIELFTLRMGCDRLVCGGESRR